MDEFSSALREALEPSGASFSVEQLDQLSAFFSMLEEANRSFNLTANMSPREAAFRHFADSLAAPALSLLKPGWKVIDVGTGAGFPGMPLAIARSNLHVVLLDSSNKKAHFLESAAEKLGLRNVAVVTARAEDYALTPAREKFDAALSRAVAPLNVLLEYTLPFVRTGGVALAWKGPAADAEIAAASNACKLLGGRDMEKYPYTLPEHGTFFIVCARKIRPSPSAYPRKAGKPSKFPIT
jgi:16S rRNA (guanine527-N7)-methyltransferase